MRLIAFFAAPLLAFLPSPTAAQQAAARAPAFALVGEVALEMGGDRFAETYFEDGSTQTMRAGQGGTAAVGLELRPHAASPFSARTTVGIKYVTTAASNVDIKLTRVPVEVVGRYRFPNEAFVGAGFVRHFAVRFDGGGLASEEDLESSNGGTLEVGWKWAALTYTMLSYTDRVGNEFDAGGVGVSFMIPLLRF